LKAVWYVKVISELNWKILRRDIAMFSSQNLQNHDYTETPIKATPINARSHFEKTYKSETSIKITAKFQFILRSIDKKFQDILKVNLI
jgi:hypothetical protein